MNPTNTNTNTKAKRGSLSAGEAGILLVLLLGVLVTIGVRLVHTGDDGEQTVVVATADETAATPASGVVVTDDPVLDETAPMVTGGDETAPAPAEDAVAVADGADDTATPDPLAGWSTAPLSQLYRAAESAYHERDYDRAAALLSLYTERRPENPWGHYLHGLALWKAGALDEAAAALRRDVELDPRHVKGHLNLARVLLAAGAADEALAEAGEAVRLDSTCVAAHRVTGLALAAAGRPADAEQAYRRALVLDPDDAWTLNDLGLLLIRAERYAEALPPLARAVQRDSTVAVYRNNLGVALERTGHAAQAAEQYAAAERLGGDERYAVSAERCRTVAERRPDEPVDLAAVAAAWQPVPGAIPALATVVPTVDLAPADSTDAAPTAGLVAARSEDGQR